MAVIEIAVGGAHQRQHSIPESTVHGARRGASAQAMDEAADPRRPIAGLEPPKLPE
jgi:hypothetical protein